MDIQLLGWIGFAILISAWVPQTWQTIKEGSTHLHIAFIIMYFTSSVLLTVYSILIEDYVFIALNALLSFGSGINLFYKLFPRMSEESADDS
jgi:MtN3 and saliva related transmembrane protein